MIKHFPFAALPELNHRGIKSRFHFIPEGTGLGKASSLGPLIAWNDGELAPMSGFPEHPPRDADFVPFVREGAMVHEDTLGNKGSAGTRRTVLSEIATVGLDLAKIVFQTHGADASGRAVLRKKLRRVQVLAFFSQLQPCVVAMEACGGAHFWGCGIGKLGHDVQLIPPAYVTPLVKRQKNDAADA